MLFKLIIHDNITNEYYYFNEVVKDEIVLESTEDSGANKLTFSYLSDNNIVVGNGSSVRFDYNELQVFYGYVFTAQENEKGEVDVVAYDSLRYFKYKDTKFINNSNNTLSKLVRQIIQDRNLVAGVITETAHVFPPEILDSQTYLDMIYDKISDQLLYTGNKYVLYDDYGQIALQEARELRLPVVIAKGNYSTYEYKKSIDGETYNIVKLAKDNKETGTRENYIAKDSSTIDKWGMLQYYEVISNDNINEAQIKDKAHKLLEYYNQEEKTLKFNCLGDSRVKAGFGVFIDIPKIKLNQWVRVKSVTHTFYPTYQIMDIEGVVS
jgi:hypothetical protein